MSQQGNGGSGTGNSGIVDVDTDGLGNRILLILEEEGGEALSTELRRAMGGVEKDRFNYRVRNHLEPAGVVVTRRVEAEDSQIPPKELTLTEEGQEYVEQLDSVDQGDAGLAERLNELEAEVETLRQKNRELREVNRELREGLDQASLNEAMEKVSRLESEVSSLQSTVNTVDQAVGEMQSDPVIESDIAPAAINGGVVLGNTCKKLLEEELGEDRVEEKRQEVKQLLRDDGSLVGKD